MTNCSGCFAGEKTNEEREQTLNQLLSEMDGFTVDQGVVFVAATNRIDLLDPAILRAGRFDEKVRIARPSTEGRFDILKVVSFRHMLSAFKTTSIFKHICKCASDVPE